LVRNTESGELEETSWENALSIAATKMLDIKQRYGADSLAFLASSRCTNEDVYALQKLARAIIGTNNVHSCAAT
jgi:predicted molibdopterin-dependent oxidoreductase YjgC